ncbi:MAG: MBL fold metallo-hydrolase [Eubacteriales bacterium]|jgi:L-ascorbate metabolism protein UlaG (beta-lactamase superfamily)|nr:MBL fold metallo-hydrolase [Eubacteriales bacterium]
MIITYQGHSQFLLESADGFRVLTDPYDESANFPVKPIPADAVTVSHGHKDHNFTAKVTGDPVIVSTQGTHVLSSTVRALARGAFHDMAGGGKRGNILLFRIEMDGLVISHLSDLGHIPDADQLLHLKGTDILLIPVGGFYTIDAAQAVQIVRALRPHMVIPMHYRVGDEGLKAVAPVDDFLKRMAPTEVSVQPLLRVTREDLSQQPRLVQLEIVQ